MDNNDDLPKIIVCIPAYNEASSIANVVKKSLSHANEVIVYDDGSIDSTADIARSSGARVVRGSENRGYGYSIRQLFRFAREANASIVITLDSDGQHDPDQIPTLIKPILEGAADVVIGSRFLNYEDQSKIPKYRSFGIKTITKLAQVASYDNISDAQSGFRAYNRLSLSRLRLYENGMGVSTEIIMRLRENDVCLTEVPVTVNYDVEQPSTHNPISHGLGVAYNIFQFISLRHPLSFYGLPGLVLLIVAAFYAYNAMELYSASRYISTNMIIVSVGTAVVGVVMLATGVILHTISALLRGRLHEN